MRAPDSDDRARQPSGPGSPHLPQFPDDGPAAAVGTTEPPGPWPTVRPPSTRTVLILRIAAVVVLGWYGAVYTVATDVLSRAPHLLAGLVVGGILAVLGTVLLWLYAARTPARVAPERGPGMGLARDRAAARKLLLSGGTPDAEQRRLVAVEVLADAKLPLVTGATAGLLGPLVVAVAHSSGPVSWLGPLTAAAILLVLVALGARTVSAYRLHRAADRRHTVPRFEESGAPWRPWP